MSRSQNASKSALDGDFDAANPAADPKYAVSTLSSADEHETLQLLDDAGDPVYQAKARVLNRAIQDIGMGRYQWYLFVVAGFGWFSDNLWPIVTGLILTPVVNEFQFQGSFLKLGQNIGLLVGAIFWGFGSDIWGRRWSFNITLLITAVFAIAAGGSPNYIALTSLSALWSVGVGGNLPVDSAVFLEFVPGSHQYLLTVLSIWWAFGQLIGSLIAWPLIANFSCPISTTSTACPRASNQGWRYFLFAMGGLMFVLWALRFFLFPLYESPKFLMGRGRDADAVAVVHRVAAFNGRASPLTVECLTAAERSASRVETEAEAKEKRERRGGGMDTSMRAAVKRKMQKYSGEHVRALFATRKLAINTSLLITLWALIGLAFPLYNSFVTFFLATRGADFGDGSLYITYRNQVILSVIGVPGALLAGWAVELPRFGRKGTLALSTILTGVFLFASTTARTSNALLGWNYHVWCPLRDLTRAVRDEGSGDRERTRRHRESHLWSDGSCDHAVRGPHHVRADLDLRRAVSGGGSDCVAPALRAERDGGPLMTVFDENEDSKDCNDIYVRMADPQKDIKTMLDLIYNPWSPSYSFRQFDPRSSLKIQPLLAMATKYGLDAVRDRLVSVIEADWPDYFEEFEKNALLVKALKKGRRKLESLDQLVPEPTAAIMIARQFNFPHILPAAFCLLSCIIITDDWDLNEPQSTEHNRRITP
ncbi:hypothetical protein EW145_g6719 [Phellinidium pouzarii]|uniref:Major facilitator superfamily (MFS) profile domain-containing protein n=1 Tax=Phellinidium pouzarii TaxID=167371 RepID=A0A4S4KV23_9AGAM|nr:hypothetical protein EW145_g6719 [Phellinidium pouzarii]